MKDIGNKCVYCLNDTSFGSGRFVNRIPALTDDYDGYACPECMEIECDRCDKTIGIDEDITIDTPTHSERVHWECFTHKEKEMEI